MATWLGNLFEGLKQGYMDAGGATPSNVFSGPTPLEGDAPAGFAGGLGNFAGGIGGMATDLALHTLPDLIKNPASFFNDRGELSITRALSPEFRREKIKEANDADERQKAALAASAIVQGHTFLQDALGLRTPEGRAAASGVYNDPRFDAAAQAAAAEGAAGQRGALAAGLLPEVAALALPEDALKAGEKQQADRLAREQNVQQAALTRQNQANAAGLERSNMYAREAEQFQRAKQLDKAKSRISRRDDRQRGRAFAQAIPSILEFENTPEGQAALRTNPALRNTVAVTKALLTGGPLPGKLAEEAATGLLSAAQKGATAQGTPEQFGMTPSIQTQIDKDLIAAQDLGMKAESVLATYDPSWSTLAGKGKLKAQGLKDVLTGQTDPNIANYRAWLQGAGELYSRNKLELTGQASNAQESVEIQRVVPDPQTLGPMQMQAALESFRANAQRKQDVLSKMKQQGRVELTTLERDYLNIKTLMDLKRSGVVSDVAFKSFFSRLTPERRKDLLNYIKAEQANANQQ